MPEIDPAKTEAVARAMCASTNPKVGPDKIWPYLSHPDAKALWRWNIDAANLAIVAADAWDEANP